MHRPHSDCRTVDVQGIGVEVVTRGSGRPLVFLHPWIGQLQAAPFLDFLAAGFQVIAPSLPGFGNSELPRHITSVDDLAYVTLDLLDALGLSDVTLVGADFGGWVAAEAAIRSTGRIARLVLLGAVGIKVGGREARDIADLFGLRGDELDRRTYCDPARFRPDPAQLPDAELRAFVRNRESVAFFGWRPYMHNPKLRSWLHRVDVPSLCLWGAQDGITTPDYGRAYAAQIRDAHFEAIEQAGHFPHIERAEATAERIIAFAAETEAGRIRAKAAAA
jgi:pimeloyl-ACP methyl ester carboxylesterase